MAVMVVPPTKPSKHSMVEKCWNEDLKDQEIKLQAIICYLTTKNQRLQRSIHVNSNKTQC